MPKRLAFLAAVLFTLGLAAAFAAAPGRLQVTYYYLPGWPICAKIKPAVSGLEMDFPGKVRAENVDATTPENKKRIKELGFQTHGLAIRSTDGKVLWKQPDHEVKMDDVRKEIAELLKK